MTSPRKLLALVAGLLLLAAVPAVAAPALSIGPATGSPGATVAVPVIFANDSDIVALQFDVVFDPSLVTAGIPAIGPDVTSGHDVDSNLVSAGRLRVIVFSTSSDVLSSGRIVVIPFTLAPTVTNPVPLDLQDQQFVQAFAVIVNGAAADGVILLGGCVPGDIYPDGVGDGSTDLLDVVLGRSKILAHAVPNARDLSCGNVFPGAVACTEPGGVKHWCVAPDGAFSLGDLIYLRRIVLGVVTITCTACAPQGAESVTLVPGDVSPRNRVNGVVDVADVVVALRMTVGLDVPTAEERARADVAPATRAGGSTLASGDGVIDVADVVLMLRAAVGLEALAWPERRMAVRLDPGPSRIAFSAAVTRWPAWVEPVSATSSECAESDLTFETAGSRWAAMGVSDPVQRSGPADVLTITYRGPRVDPATLAVDVQIVVPGMRQVAGQATLQAR